jgi:hypothetical protein
MRSCRDFAEKDGRIRSQAPVCDVEEEHPLLSQVPIPVFTNERQRKLSGIMAESSLIAAFPFSSDLIRFRRRNATRLSPILLSLRLSSATVTYK